MIDFVKTARAVGFHPDMAAALASTCLRYGITTELEQEHFLAQVAWESSTGRQLRELWGPTEAQQAYEGRTDLGNTKPGDGFRFRGRGTIQCTGRGNYTAYSHAKYGDDRVVSEPVMLELLPDAADVAGWYWQKHGINAAADKDDLVAVTRKVNGGTNGLLGRRRWLAKIRANT